MKVHEILLLELKYEDLPKTYYGYWITDDGRFLPADTQKHGEVAREELLKNYGYKGAGINAYEAAFNEGWIRLIFNPFNHETVKTMAIHIAHKTAKKAKQQLFYLLKMFRKELTYIATSAQTTHDEFRGPNAAGKAMLFINKHA